MCEISIKINVCHGMTARRDVSRWNIDDNETIAFSDQSAFSSSPTSLVQHHFNPFERTNDWILKDFSYQLEQVETLSRSCVSMRRALFFEIYKRKIYVKIRTKQSFIRALSRPIAQQRSAISSSYIFLRYEGIKADTFAWPSFSLWTKKVPVVMSEFSTPRAERSQRNRYADATFYFSKRIAFGFSGFMEQRKMSPFSYELLL